MFFAGTDPVSSKTVGGPAWNGISWGGGILTAPNVANGPELVYDDGSGTHPGNGMYRPTGFGYPANFESSSDWAEWRGVDVEVTPEAAAGAEAVAGTTDRQLRRVTANSAGDSWSDLVFCWIGRVAFWLLQGERDRSADELEGLPLGAGRLGEHRDGDLGAGVPDLVAGQGGQVLQQAAEAAVGLPGRVVLV